LLPTWLPPLLLPRLLSTWKRQEKKMWWNEISWHILQRYQHIQQQRDKIMSNTFNEMRDTRKGSVYT
jgi:hypothetical protein